MAFWSNWCRSYFLTISWLRTLFRQLVLIMSGIIYGIGIYWRMTAERFSFVFRALRAFFVFGNMVLFSGDGRKIITPNFEATEAMAARHQMYNHQMDELESLYQIGIREAEMRFDDIRSFLAGGEA